MTFTQLNKKKLVNNRSQYEPNNARYKIMCIRPDSSESVNEKESLARAMQSKPTSLTPAIN
jgi:hypothetical protein